MPLALLPPNIRIPPGPFSRASFAWEQLDSGIWREVGVDNPRGNSTGALYEGAFTNRIVNPRFVGATDFHTGTPARIKPVVSTGVITGCTILEAGDNYVTAPTLTAVGTGGSGFVATCNLTGGVVTSVTISNGGSGYPDTTGMVTKSGASITSWTRTCSQGSFASIAIVGQETIEGIPCLIVRFIVDTNFAYFRPTISSTAVTAGDIVRQSAFMKLISSVEFPQYVDAVTTYLGQIGGGFDESGGLSRRLYRNDLFVDFPDDLHEVSHNWETSDGITALTSTVSYHVSSNGSGLVDVTMAIGAPFLGVSPRRAMPIMPASGATGAATKAVDVKIRQDFSSFNSAGWGIVIDGYLEHGDDVAARILFQMDDGTDGNAITVRTAPNTNALVAEVTVSSVITATTAISRSVMPGQRFRALLTGASGSLDLTVDGGATNSVSTTLPTVTRAREGNNLAGSLSLNGRIAALQILNTRPSAAERTAWSSPDATIGSAAGSPTADDSFTIVFLPDTHVTTSSSTEWDRIWNWILDNQEAHNIIGVVGEGDVVTNASDALKWQAEFDLAVPGWEAFDTALIPNIAGIGNHDYDTDASVTDRLSTRFETKLPLSRMSGKSWYGGSYAGESKNSWIKFAYGSRKFLVINLEIWPDDDMLTWALGICNNNLDRDAVLITHSHQDPDGTLTAAADLFGFGTKSYSGNDGFAVWDKLGKLAPNLKFVVSGHQYRATAAAKTSYLPDTGDDGNAVHQWFCNYQTVSEGFGYIGLLRFHSNGDEVDLCAYSTISGQRDEDSVLRFVW